MGLELGDFPRDQAALHALNRAAFGPRPGDLERAQSMGVERWLDQQLHPESIPIPDDPVEQIRAYHTLHMTPVALFIEYQRPVMEARREFKGAGNKAEQNNAVKEARQKARIVMLEAVEARLARAIYGPRQLQEVMTHFWFNHFNIFAGKGLDDIWTASFEEQAIRPHTMGRFRTLLGATAKHPAMLFYLDNWQNTAPGSPGARGQFEGINENYARELMELHTLGVNGGYSQQDVIALAHILTGWGLVRERGGGGGGGPRTAAQPNQFRNFAGAAAFVPFARLGAFRPHQRMPGGPGTTPIDPSGFYFDPERHDSSSKTLLGHTIEGSGIREGEQALDLLARHPSTANHLSFQLAQYFVADDPPKPLVKRMAARYLATDGDIRAVLETMFKSPEFWDRRALGAKFKTPYEYVISCARLSGYQITNYRPLYGTMQLLGMPLYGCLTPNGYSNTEDAWLNPDGMMTRLSFATALASGNLPLNRPPFEEVEAGGGERDRAARIPRVVTKKGGANANVRFHDRPGAGGAKMTPLDAQQLSAALGGRVSSATAEAVEAAPPLLRGALVLGSPEFMKR